MFSETEEAGKFRIEEAHLSERWGLFMVINTQQIQNLRNFGGKFRLSGQSKWKILQHILTILTELIFFTDVTSHICGL